MSSCTHPWPPHALYHRLEAMSDHERTPCSMRPPPVLLRCLSYVVLQPSPSGYYESFTEVGTTRCPHMSIFGHWILSPGITRGVRWVTTASDSIPIVHDYVRKCGGHQSVSRCPTGRLSEEAVSMRDREEGGASENSPDVHCDGRSSGTLHVQSRGSPSQIAS